jgi:hypothetical protein
MQHSFTPEERQALLDAYFAALAERRRLGEQALAASAGQDEAAPVETDEALEVSLAALEQEMERLWMTYAGGVPHVGLSRCPFTGEVFTHSLDYYGLDGLWWHYEAAARPEEEYLPTFFALDGALALSEPLDNTPLLVATGPEIPFVLPRLLQYTQIKAVLSSFGVGHHQAYFIVYYADPMLWEIDRVNEWGADYYRYVDIEGALQVDAYLDDERDFDLEAWIRAGQLLWIAPGDAEFQLRGHLTDCPYLNLPGSRNPVYLQNGERWEGENLDDAWVDANSLAEGAWSAEDQQALERALKLWEEGNL